MVFYVLIGGEGNKCFFSSYGEMERGQKLVGDLTRGGTRLLV